MQSYLSFKCEGGPLDGLTIVIVQEDVYHPDVVEIQIENGTDRKGFYERRTINRVLVWHDQGS